MSTDTTQAITWTPVEVTLWETAKIIGDLLRGTTPQGQPSSFALRLGGPAEVLLLADGYRRSWFGAVGDGTYRTSTTFVGGLSPVGILTGALTLGTSAAGNARRRAQAAADMTPRWRDFDHGSVHVTTSGFYLETGGQLLAFGFNAIHRMDLMGPGQVQFTVAMDNGTVQTFIVASAAAELLFALWAFTCCPSHPQFTGLTWLPDAFLARIRQAGLIESLGAGQLGTLGQHAASLVGGHQRSLGTGYASNGATR